MILRRTFHTAPEERSGPEQGQGRMGCIPSFWVLKLFQVACFNIFSMLFRCPALVPVSVSVKGFCILSVPVLVPVPVLVTASVVTPLQVKTFLNVYK